MGLLVKVPLQVGQVCTCMWCISLANLPDVILPYTECVRRERIEGDGREVRASHIETRMRHGSHAKSPMRSAARSVEVLN